MVAFSSTIMDKPKKAVILVDPLSTGALMQARVLAAGLNVILVWSDRTQPITRGKHFAHSGLTAEQCLAVVVHEGNLEDTVNAITDVKNNVEVVSIICGSEFGVLLEDALADALNKAWGTNHLLSSGMPDSRLKVDKYLQSERVRAAGLDTVRQTLAHCEEDVKVFLAEQGNDFKAVAKPQTGAGSVGVTFCDSASAVWEAYDSILGGEHKSHCSDRYRHYDTGVLLQEYLEGTEYIVNTVSLNGETKVTAAWKYDKRPYNGGSFVCFGKLLLDANEPHLSEILDYTDSVLKALQFGNGSVHAEIMYIEGRGPVLIEANCRLHGGYGAWVRPAETCIGYSQLSIMMDAYLNNGRGSFSEIPSRPAKVNGGCYVVKMRTRASGILEEVIASQLDRIKALPSYKEHFFKVQPGDTIHPTVDMPSVPGEVTLVHSDKLTLEEDYKTLNIILHEGILMAKEEESCMHGAKLNNAALFSMSGGDSATVSSTSCSDEAEPVSASRE